MSKIAIFLPSLGGGGAERINLNLAEGFLARNLEVDIVLVRAKGPLLAAVPPRAQVIDLGAGRTLTSLAPLADYLRHVRPQALIAAPDHTNLVAIWGKLLAASCTRVVVTNHTDVAIAARYSQRLFEKIYPRLLRLFRRAAYAIVSVSSGSADSLSRLARIPRGEINVIYNPIVSPSMDGLMVDPLDHPWFEPGHPPVILAVGRLESEKDYPTLLRAFSILRKRGPMRLVILGEGSQRDMLISLGQELGIQEDLAIQGYDLNPYRYMSRCNVFVLTSLREGLSTVLVEALACGAQVVSTDCPSGPAEILEHGRFGRLVPVGDVAALEEAMADALDAPLPIADLQARASVFSVEKATDRYLDLLGLG